VSGVKITWEADKFKRKMAAKVINGMDRVGQFCAETAADNAPRRSGALAANITYKVEAQGMTVTAIVGARAKVFWAWFVELGTSGYERGATTVSGHTVRRRIPARPAHPFLRPAVFGNAKEIMRLFVGKG
jgi:HK97 gp10 family phage protein